uniref:Uncharacterized protein n=1 Tax=Haptolina ericina TaxID=156174 RepID=A0A7S3BTT8_9EUKA
MNQAFHAMPRQPAHALVTFHPLRLPHALVRLSSTAVDAVGSAGAVEVTGDSLQYEPRPSYSRSARRARLHAALEACRAGGEFVVPPPEVTSIPGPCGAVMNVLRVYGPQETKPLFTLCEKHYPGAVKSLHHLRKRICNDALRNRLIKIRSEGRGFKKLWAIRKPGQIRSRVARSKDVKLNKSRSRHIGWG